MLWEGRGGGLYCLESVWVCCVLAHTGKLHKGS